MPAAKITEPLTESTTVAEQLQLVAHDLRQPLSGIENIAFILEMGSTGLDPKMAARLSQLRNLVDQVSWILEDSVRAAQVQESHPSAIDLCGLVRTFAAEAALRDDRSLNLRLPAQPLIAQLDDGVTRNMLQWILHFGLTMAQPSDSPELRCAEVYGRARVTVTITPGDRDVSMMAELIDPRGRTGYLRSLANAQAVDLRVGDCGSGGLSIDMDYVLA